MLIRCEIIPTPKREREENASLITVRVLIKKFTMNNVSYSTGAQKMLDE